MAISSKESQEFVPIKEIKNGVIILKNGGFRAVLLVSSINLSLKSDLEQEAIIKEFQSFINSLDFSVQIVVQSRRLDIRPYLLKLEERLNNQHEELLKVQTREYIEFIKTFTNEVNIMTKNFFIVIPYEPNIIKGASGAIDQILGGISKNKTVKIEDPNLISFEENRSQLDQRVTSIIEGLNSIGLRSVQLKTEELTELFYKTFNPGDISQGIKLEK